MPRVLECRFAPKADKIAGATLVLLRANALNRFAIVAAVARPERCPRQEIAGSGQGALS